MEVITYMIACNTLVDLEINILSQWQATQQMFGRIYHMSKHLIDSAP